MLNTRYGLDRPGSVEDTEPCGTLSLPSAELCVSWGNQSNRMQRTAHLLDTWKSCEEPLHLRQAGMYQTYMEQSTDPYSLAAQNNVVSITGSYRDPANYQPQLLSSRQTKEGRPVRGRSSPEPDVPSRLPSQISKDPLPSCPLLAVFSGALQDLGTTQGDLRWLVSCSLKREAK